MGLIPRRSHDHHPSCPLTKSPLSRATGVRTAPLCFASRGFSLHAATWIAGPDRRGLERLCRYVARPALAGGCLRILDADHLSFALKTPWSNGTSHLLLSPMELLDKLAALVPPPRFHLLRYHGILVGHLAWKSPLNSKHLIS